MSFRGSESGERERTWQKITTIEGIKLEEANERRKEKTPCEGKVIVYYKKLFKRQGFELDLE